MLKCQLTDSLKRIIKVLSIISLIIISIAPVSFVQAYQQVDRPIALVGNSPVTIQDVESFLVRENIPINRNNLDLAFKELINSRLLENEAERRNIQVSNQILDQQILNIAEQNNVSLRELYDEIQNSYPGGFTKYRDGIRLAILREQIKQRIILPRVNDNLLNDSEVNFPISKSDQSQEDGSEKQVVIQQIIIQGDKVGRYSKILEAYQKLEMGISFTEVAKIYSEEDEQDRGGMIGWIDMSSLDQGFQNAISRLKNHQHSRPKQIGGQWYLFKLIDSREIKKELFQQMKTGINTGIINEEFNRWLNEIRTQSFIEIKQELWEEYLSQVI